MGGITKEGRLEVADSPKPYGDVAYADPKNGKYPISTKAQAKAAWSYINMPKNAAMYPMNGVTLSSVKSRIMAACKKFGITISDGNSAPQDGEVRAWDPDGDGDDDSTPEGDTDHSHWTAGGKQLKSVPGKPMPGQPPAPRAAALDGEYRTVPFDLASAEANGDGLTFSGYAAVFNTVTRIAGWDEDFDEQLAPGSWDRTLAAGMPRLMFEHGRHSLIGTMPLGVLHRAEPDSQGVFVEGRLIDNWLISPVRDAVAAGALDGMSFRFTVDDDGEAWMDRSGDVPLRTLTSISVPELGPVVFPAYEPTTASVRSQLDKLPVIGRPPAGARAATGREGSAGQRLPQPPLSELYRRDGEALALRGIKGARI